MGLYTESNSTSPHNNPLFANKKSMGFSEKSQFNTFGKNDSAKMFIQSINGD